MSEFINYLVIRPEAGNHNRKELFEKIYRCPACNVKEGQDFSGWSAKFKSNYDDPDWKPCQRCDGTGKLKAVITVNWEPPDKDLPGSDRSNSNLSYFNNSF